MEEVKQIDNQLNIIRDKGRQNLLEVSPDKLTRILHDYSDNKKGFIIWKLDTWAESKEGLVGDKFMGN